MVSWLLIIVLAYFFFSLAALGDKLILKGPPKPNSYTFFAGATSVAVILFLPFISLQAPSSKAFFWIIAEAVIFILGLYVMYSALEKFDVSRVATTMGAAQPILIFLFSWIIWGPQKMGWLNALAFILLILGTVVISINKNFKATKDYFRITLFASLLFSLDYVFTKIVFLFLPFWSGLFWMKIIAFCFAMLLLLSKNNRKDILAKKNFLNKKTGVTFALTNLSGGIATLLQAFAIALAPVAFLPILNSLRGVQYVFLFLITLSLSFFIPKILKEEISTKIILQKIASILLIAAGLALLVF